MYKVTFTPQAEADLSKMDVAVAKRIVDKIEWLSQNVENIKMEPLRGKFSGQNKLRVGDWRIIYSVEYPAQIITIYAIDHRSKIYKV